jgi:excisionase family DNA binding protein
MNPIQRPVIIIVGHPDDTLLTGLRSVGLTPIAEDGPVVVWGRPTPRPDTSIPTAEPGAPNGAGLLMTIRDAALALGLGRSTVYELIGRGELEVVHVGRSARIPTTAVHSLIERLRTASFAGARQPMSAQG